jgi:serine/threonine protein kinase
MENIMIKDKKPILIDFGFSSKINNIPENIVFGSMGYMSPELLKGGKFDPQKNDVWAIGILAYKLVTNKFPFMGSTFEELYRKIKFSQKINLGRIENHLIK